MTMQKTRDGPATVFEPDPFVSKIVQLKNNNDILSNMSGNEFGLVVVAGWPQSKEVIDIPYSKFIQEVEACFHEKDVASNAVYLYPSCCLHVTIASPYPFTLNSDKINRETHANFWKDIIVHASQHVKWPTISKIQLKLSRTQIGTKAGILLWEEDESSSNSIALIRKCIQNETDSRKEEALKLGVDLTTLSVPPIIHSTFLRFLRKPSFSSGDAVQEKFQRNIVSCLQQYFSDGITLDSLKLVCEKTPYMHVPNDDSHVLYEIKLK